MTQPKWVMPESFSLRCELILKGACYTEWKEH